METEVLSEMDKYNEYIMTGLRTVWGISLSKIESEFGTMYRGYVLRQAEKYIHDELLFLDSGVIVTTKKGKFLVDGIASDLFMIKLG